MLSIVSDKLYKAHYSTEIESIDIESPDYKENKPGSWHIDKTAKWLNKDTAEVTFDVTSNRSYYLALSISLKPDIKIKSGSGYLGNPYIIELE